MSTVKITYFSFFLLRKQRILAPLAFQCSTPIQTLKPIVMPNICPIRAYINPPECQKTVVGIVAQTLIKKVETI